jgi:hypothetical protein
VSNLASRVVRCRRCDRGRGRFGRTRIRGDGNGDDHGPPNDQTNSGSGWNISGTSTTFTTGAHTLAATATQVTGGSVAAASQNCSLPTSSIAYPVTLPAAATAPAAVKLYNAAVNTGAGPSTVTLTFVLALPAATYTGTYNSTWTFTIGSGP